MDWYKFSETTMRREIENILYTNAKGIYKRKRVQKEAELDQVQTERQRILKRRQKGGARTHKLRQNVRKKFKIIMYLLAQTVKDIKSYYHVSDSYRIKEWTEILSAGDQGTILYLIRRMQDSPFIADNLFIYKALYIGLIKKNPLVIEALDKELVIIIKNILLEEAGYQSTVQNKVYI